MNLRSLQGIISAWLLLPVFLAGCESGNLVRDTSRLPQVTATRSEFPPVSSLPAEKNRPAPSEVPPIRLTPSPTREQPPTASPTSLFVFDLTGYDPDIFQPIDIVHNPPLIARSGEKVRLVFDLVNPIYCQEVQRYCRLEPRLYYTYGDSEAFQGVPLAYQTVNGLESLVARLPASDTKGNSLRYYAEFAVTEAGYTLRYPVEGTIELFTVDSFTPIEFPVENPAAPGEVVYDFLWGYGPDKVRKGSGGGGRYIIAPPALDVAPDGRLALMDPVNERVILFNPAQESYSSVSLPFPYRLNADLAFDKDGQLVVCDWAGGAVEGIPSIPYCYRLRPDGSVAAASPVYAKFPGKITKDLEVLDGFDSRMVLPFKEEGEPNSREDQRGKETWQLPCLFVQDGNGSDRDTIRFADIQKDIAFEFQPPAGYGGLVGCEKTPQGYLLIFSGTGQIRAVWIDEEGNILKDVTLPRGNNTELSLYGNVAVSQDGSLYALSSTERGIEIHYVEAPKD